MLLNLLVLTGIACRPAFKIVVGSVVCCAAASTMAVVVVVLVLGSSEHPGICRVLVLRTGARLSKYSNDEYEVRGRE
jgi:hypothetical protein